MLFFIIFHVGLSCERCLSESRAHCDISVCVGVWYCSCVLACCACIGMCLHVCVFVCAGVRVMHLVFAHLCVAHFCVCAFCVFAPFWCLRVCLCLRVFGVAHFWCLHIVVCCTFLRSEFVTCSCSCTSVVMLMRFFIISMHMSLCMHARESLCACIFV